MPPLYKEAILLVGGKGTRLRAAVPGLPKVGRHLILATIAIQRI